MKVGDKCETGQIVKYILGSSHKATVYTTEDNCLRWKFHENEGVVPEKLMPAIHEFDSLMAEIKNLLPKSIKNEAYVRLGKSLFVAFNGSNEGYDGKVYDNIRSFIERIAQQKARTLYVSICVLFALSICCLTVAIVEYFDIQNFALYIYGGAAGAMGACISVMQRTTATDLDWRLLSIDLLLQAITRILLGLSFGIFFVMACKADLVLGAVKENIAALLVFSVISGISERFIPELISKLEAKGVESV